MSDLREMTSRIVNFRDARNWKQFHTPKDMALSLVLESTEFMEHFQWKNDTEVSTYLETQRDALGEELADVLYWVLLLAHDLDIDIEKAFSRKMKINEQKYPLEQARGSAAKYSAAPNTKID